MIFVLLTAIFVEGETIQEQPSYYSITYGMKEGIIYPSTPCLVRLAMLTPPSSSKSSVPSCVWLHAMSRPLRVSRQSYRPRTNGFSLAGI